MPGQVRESTATVRWLTHPPEGMPRLTVGSHTLPPVSLSINEIAPHPLATSPGELIAGALGSVVAWLLAEELVQEGTQARELIIDVGLTAKIRAGVDARDPALSEIHCHAQARLPGGDAQRLQALSETALRRCARLVGLREDIALRVDSTAIAAN
jgi:hypothetical protein